MGCSGEKRRLISRSVPIALSMISVKCGRYLERSKKVASGVVKDATLDNMEVTLRDMREMTKNAEHAMHTVVLYCKRARRQMLVGVRASKPTIHCPFISQR